MFKFFSAVIITIAALLFACATPTPATPTVYFATIMPPTATKEVQKTGTAVSTRTVTVIQSKPRATPTLTTQEVQTRQVGIDFLPEELKLLGCQNPYYWVGNEANIVAYVQFDRTEGKVTRAVYDLDQCILPKGNLLGFALHVPAENTDFASNVGIAPDAYWYENSKMHLFNGRQSFPQNLVPADELTAGKHSVFIEFISYLCTVANPTWNDCQKSVEIHGFQRSFRIQTEGEK